MKKLLPALQDACERGLKVTCAVRKRTASERLGSRDIAAAALLEEAGVEATWSRTDRRAWQLSMTLLFGTVLWRCSPSPKPTIAACACMMQNWRRS